MPRILIADDLPMFRERISQALCERGYETVCAEDGLKVLSEAHQLNARPDLILLDMALPTLDGLNTLLRIRKDLTLANVPVIVLSDDNDRNKIVQAAELGISGYIFKPAMELEDLLQRIEAIVGPSQDSAMTGSAAALI